MPDQPRRLRRQLDLSTGLPLLPPGWLASSAMVAAEDAPAGGDFVVADITGDTRLQAILVDVCGHGPAAVAASLRLAGALEGLIVAVPEDDILPAVNRFLLRQSSDENLATAVHVSIDLLTGDYRIRSAGHPPALRWSGTDADWRIDNARGTTLGAVAQLDADDSKGTLGPGDALLFYTDGVVESRGADIDSGIAWLRAAATRAMPGGVVALPAGVLAEIPRGDDDRAVLALGRSGNIG